MGLLVGEEAKGNRSSPDFLVDALQGVAGVDNAPAMRFAMVTRFADAAEIAEPLGQDAAQVTLVEDEHMIRTRGSRKNAHAKPDP